MNGVEILNTTYEYDSLIDPLWVAICLFVGLIIATIGAHTIDYDTVQRILQVLIVVVGICFVACLVGSLIKTDKIVETKHQVIVSEDVNLEEFLDKYEILDQEDKIYTVKERE